MCDLLCPKCNTTLQKNTLECVGIDEMDFVSKSDVFKFGINIQLGSFSLGKSEIIHGALTDLYLCIKCKKIFAVYNLEK